MGKSTLPMVMFHSYVSLPEGIQSCLLDQIMQWGTTVRSSWLTHAVHTRSSPNRSQPLDSLDRKGT